MPSYLRNMETSTKQRKSSNHTIKWIFSETKLRELKHHSRKIVSDCTTFYQEMEKKLYHEFLEIRNNGMKVIGWWRCQTAQKIMNELHPNINLRMCN